MERGLVETPYGYIHYTNDLPALQSLAQRSEGETIPGARFCATWSHAQHIAKRAHRFIGV